MSWQLVGPGGPNVYMHAGVVVPGSALFYVHGGQEAYRAAGTPLNCLHRFDMEVGSWSKLSLPGAPCLSHHAMVVLNDRYPTVVGGWTGKIRDTRVHVCDVNEGRWLECRTAGFPQGGGLSAHCAKVLNDSEILVIGREGSLRTQRRAGNGFLMKGSMEKGYQYEPVFMGLDSRSGHSANFLRKCGLVLIGGRESNFVDVIRFDKRYDPPEPVADICPLTAKAKPCKKEPSSRKAHIAVTTGHGVFVHGGETFDGKSKIPQSEMFLFDSARSWALLGPSGLHRAGHVVGVCRSKIFIQGGVNENWQTNGNCYRLNVDHK